MKSAHVLIDDRGPEIQHRTGITAPDPFIYIAIENKAPVVLFDAREFGVMKEKLNRLNNGVEIEPLEPYLEKVPPTEEDSLASVLIEIARENEVKELYIAGSLNYATGKKLEDAGLKLVIHGYDKERELKTDQEISHLIAAQRVNESAFMLVWEILASSKINSKGNIEYEKRLVTSEWLKSVVKKHLLDQGYSCPDGIIVASGEQTSQPHNEGGGPLLANESIIIDIFPRSEETGYYADMTRTFVKGEPSRQLEELFVAVEEVQRRAATEIKVGDKCAAVHQGVVDHFARLGYETSHEKGFMHSTGHSLGLNVHEGPRLNIKSQRKVEPGMVFTIEPGLYYPGLGGVRIEDVLIFHPDGQKENITQFNKSFLIP